MRVPASEFSATIFTESALAPRQGEGRAPHTHDSAPAVRPRPLADDFEPHLAGARADQADRLRGAAREVDGATLVRGEAVVDPDHDALAGGRERHLHAGA